MSLSAAAAFLSYAAEHVEAAERIAESLRAPGIEVWLDRSELRGGDAAKVTACDRAYEKM